MKITETRSTGGKLFVRKLDPGVFVVEVPEVRRSISFGQPPDVIKRLQQAGYAGPNAITTFVLCDSKTQGDSISWVLVEFPLLYALYYLPVTANGKTMPAFYAGKRPLVAGLEADVRMAMLMMKYGNYGVDHVDEFDTWDLPDATRDALRQEILGLAVGNTIKDSTEFMTPVHLDPAARSEREFSDLGDGIALGRLGFNKYRVIYGTDSIDVDVTLAPTERFNSPIAYRHIKFPVINFGVWHTGEYDGMDANYSCAHTTLVHRYEPVMIDYPSNMTDIVAHYGLSKQAVANVFLTHNHDDHIGAMVELLRRPERTHVVTTRPVQESVVRKISALADMPVAMVKEQFAWTLLPFRKDAPFQTEPYNLDGLVAEGHLSCHSVPTTVYTISANHDGHRYTYGHFLDMVAFRRMDKLVKDGWMPAAHLAHLDEVVRRRAYNLIKWDVGCTSDASLAFTVHGQWQDLIGAATEKQFRVFTHATKELLDPAFEKEGRFVSVGDVDVTLRDADGTMVSLANHKNAVTAFYSRAFRVAMDYLTSLVGPGVSASTWNHMIHYASAFANCPKAPDSNIGAYLFEQGKPGNRVYMIVRGMVEHTRLEEQDGGERMLGIAGGGEVLGDIEALAGLNHQTSARVVNRVAYVGIPANLFVEALDAIGVRYEGRFRDLFRKRFLMRRAVAFSRDLSTNMLSRIAQASDHRSVAPGDVLFEAGGDSDVLLVVSDEVELRRNGTVERVQGPTLVGECEFFLPGEDNPARRLTTAIALKPAEVVRIPFNVARASPAAVTNIIALIRRRRESIYQGLPGIEPHYEG